MAATLRLVIAVPPKPGHQYVVAALEVNGSCEYKDYVGSKAFRSNRNEATKVLQMLKTLAEQGDLPFKGDKTQLRDVGDGLQELKPKKQRLLIFRAGVTWIITSALPKPAGQAKVQDAWISKGKERKALYLELLQKGKIKTL